MKVVMTNDTGSFWLKKAVAKYLDAKKYDILDKGTKTPEEFMDYVTAGKIAAETIKMSQADYGVIFCGSGAGVMMAANKHKGVYAVVCESIYTSKQARMINNSNILCMGVNVVDEESAKAMAETFLNTDFAEGFDEEKKQRLAGYVSKIRGIESQFCR